MIPALRPSALTASSPFSISSVKRDRERISGRGGAFFLTSLSKNSLIPWLRSFCALRLVSTSTGYARMFRYSTQQANRVLARSPTRPEICMRKYGLSSFLPDYPRHRDDLGVRLVSACPAVGKPQPSERRCPGQPSPVHGHGLLQRPTVAGDAFCG
jgi:hypothetical protein